jgi:hypothetical protein
MARTSMTTLQDALFRIEPTRGLVSYTEDVKPYHSKILDVLIEYVYEERIEATVTEKWKWEIHWDERWDADRGADWLAGRTAPTVTYSCGYGLVWDHASTADSNPRVDIVHISPASHTVLGITPTVGAVKAKVTVAGNVALDFPAGSVFRLSGSTYSNSSLTLPANITEFTVFGTPVYVNGRTVVTILETLLPAVDLVLGTAYAMVDRFEAGLPTPANSFLVTTPTATPHSFVVSDLDSNQLTIVDRSSIIAVNAVGKTWTISGNKVADIEVGSYVYVTSNHNNANGKYTVLAVALSSGNTQITVKEPIFTTATASGYLAFPLRTVDEYTITNINTTNRQITVAGNHTASVIPGMKLWVHNGPFADPADHLTHNHSADDEYTIESVAVNGFGNTVYTVKNSITVTYAALSVLSIERLPAWVSGTQIKLSGTGVQPAPLATASDYYFHPTKTPGVFNLGYIRYPSKYDDIVDVTSYGVGEIKIARGELYQPGAVINVDHTYSTGNRGAYYVKNTVVDGIYTRIYVMQGIEFPHGGTSSLAGTTSLGGMGFDEPSYCPLASAPSLYTDTYIHEHLQFTVEVFQRDNISTTAEEYRQYHGWGQSPYSGGLLGPYATAAYGDIPSRFAMTSGNPPADGAHVLLPTGYDTQLYGIGGMCESYIDVQNFYGRTLP